MDHLTTIKLSGIFESSAPAAELRAVLESIRSLDVATTGRQIRVARVGLVLLLAGVVLGVLGLILAEGAHLRALRPMIYVGAVVLLAGIGAFVWRVFLRALDSTSFEPRRYGLTSQLLDLVGRDVGAQVPVSLRLDLRPATHADKPETTAHPTHLLAVTERVDPWLTLTARLLDGTAATITVTERVRVEKGYREGKRKYRIREKRSHLFGVTLRVKPERFPGLASVDDAAQASLRLPPGVAARLKAMPRGLGLSTRAAAWSLEPTTAGGPAVNAPHLIAVMLLNLYGILGRCRDPKPAAAATTRGA